jgi:hypothetical protein
MTKKPTRPIRSEESFIMEIDGGESADFGKIFPKVFFKKIN